MTKEIQEHKSKNYEDKADKNKLKPINVLDPGTRFWQAEFERGKWQDVNKDWNEPLFKSCEAGDEEIRLEQGVQGRIKQQRVPADRVPTGDLLTQKLELAVWLAQQL